MSLPENTKWMTADHLAVHWHNPDGSYESRILGDVELMEWLESGNQPIEADPPPRRINLTRAEFLARFTADEQLAVHTAAQSTPAIGVWLMNAQAVSVIELDNPGVKAGLDVLVAASVITADRETEILA